MPAPSPLDGDSPEHVEKPSLRMEVGDTAYVSSTRLTGGLDEGEVLRGVEFDDCTFEGNVLVGARLVGCSFTECTFTEVDLSRADLTDSRFAECVFIESRMLGVNFALGHTGTLSAPFRFERCRLDYASFRGLDVSGSVWRDCRLAETDFGEAVARRVDFAGSDLSRAIFAGTDLREASFVGAVAYDFDIRENQVRGARFEVSEAGILLRHFGIELVHPG